MSEGETASLDGLVRALVEGDESSLPARKQDFVAHHRSLIAVIDRLAQADFVAGNYTSAARKLEILEELLPEIDAYFIRRAAASARAGTQGAIEELVASPGRIKSDHDLFHAVDELIFNGRADLAERLITACDERPEISAGLRTVVRSRILAASGHLSQALEAIAAEAQSDDASAVAMRFYYLTLERLLEFEAAQKAGSKTALVWGEEWDLRHLVEQLLYVFDFGAAEKLLHDFCERHPRHAPLVGSLFGDVGRFKAVAEAAMAEHGPPFSAEPAAIYAALSQAGTSPSRILWGKLSLVALLRNGAFTAADHARFAWFLPNWEEAQIRQHVLSAARRYCPEAASAKRGWLHYLISIAAYGDAADHCRFLMDGPADEDILFFVVMLLRLQKDAMVPSFMTPELFELLRASLLSKVAGSSPGFRCVMHDHFVALGWEPEPWPDDALLPEPSPEAARFRRLFASTTGRLSVVSTPARRISSPAIRPVLAISGQLRGFETAWKSIRTHLLDTTKAPLVMSVWDKSMNAKGRHARRLERSLPEDVIARLKPEERYTDTFEVAYPKTAQLVFGQTDVDALSLRQLIDGSGCDVVAVETESERIIERILPAHVSSNMLKMYYKFTRLEALLRDAECQSGDTFSHVIWSRPDCQILRLSAGDLNACLARSDLVWSSFVTETSFGDYAMVLPRRAFATIAGIFPRVVAAGDTGLLPWRPNRAVTPDQRDNLDAFGGPDIFFDMLLAAGYMPINGIPRMVVRLLGRMPGAETVRAAFEAEQEAYETEARRKHQVKEALASILAND